MVSRRLSAGRGRDDQIHAGMNERGFVERVGRDELAGAVGAADRLIEARAQPRARLRANLALRRIDAGKQGAVSRRKLRRSPQDLSGILRGFEKTENVRISHCRPFLRLNSPQLFQA